MVRHAFEVLTCGRVPTRLICFSDDMDGLRRVAPNLPRQEMLAASVGLPLSRVPDPFGTHDSFAAHNNAQLRAFLDAFGFDYEFASASQHYSSGVFDQVLLRMLERYDEIMAVMLPTLGPERRATYSPFMPISPTTGRVLQVPTLARDTARGTITFQDEDGARIQQEVTGGKAKVQWRPDWALRWAALGVDYEMSGKDLIDSVKVSSALARVLGADPPEGFNYELFLDEKGERISKTKGNGITIEEWLTYASPESLSLFMYQTPRKAKRLYFDVIPRQVDDYLAFLERYGGEPAEKRIDNPVWHIHAGKPHLAAAGGAGGAGVPISFAMLLNLASASNSEDRAVLWGFIRRYAPGTGPETHPKLDELVGYAIAYFHDFVKPAKRYRAPDAVERAALAALADRLAGLPEGADAQTVQSAVLEVARGIERYQDPGKPQPDGRPGVSRDWFKAIYEVLLGESAGPRFGSFAALYGVPETAALIGRALAGELTTEPA
jgi:lysyl-tRNA synthetase class 1